jgi:hypothetical protein
MARSPLSDVLTAATAALARYGVVPVRHSTAAALYRLEYDRGGATVAAVGWGDPVLVVASRLAPEVTALVAAHARLACVESDEPAITTQANPHRR